MDFLCIENIPSSIFRSYPPVRTTGGFLFCRFSVGRAAPRCKSAANVLLLLLVSSAAFCAGIIWNVSLYSTVKRKRKYFAKINTLQSPRCTGGGIAVRGGRAGLSVCTGSIDYFCFRPDGYAGGRVPARSDPVGFSVAAQGLLGIVVAVGSIVLPLWWLLRATRLQTQDLRILLPAPWSPAFCLVVFLGLANAGNLFGGLLARGLGVTTSSTALPAGGLDLFIRYFSLCVVPAVLEELYFRGALRGHYAPQRQQRGDFCPCPAVCVAAPGSGTKHYRAGVRRSFWAGWLSAAAVFFPACCCISSTITLGVSQPISAPICTGAACRGV